MKIKTNCIKIFPHDKTFDSIVRKGTMRVKLGIDATGDRIHLGHLIPLLLANELSDMGHRVEIVIGTSTARIGDPTGVEKTRPILSIGEVQDNAERIECQIEDVFENRFEILDNSEWFPLWSMEDLLHLLSHFTVARLTSRDNFRNRMNDGNSVRMHELIVPIMQGIDSVQMDATVEIGGTDQLFNFDITREVQRIKGKEPQDCLMTPLIVGTDGNKMSKSKGNCIFLDSSPETIFGQVMSISDETMGEWLKVFDIDGIDEIEHPMDQKKILAETLVEFLHGREQAELSREGFESVVQKKETPDDMKAVLADDLLEAVVTMRVVSKSKARRLIGEGAVKVNGERKMGIIDLSEGDVVQIGKRDFGKVIHATE